MQDICKEYYENLPLAGLTTLKIGGNAQMAFFPENIDELKGVVDYLHAKGEEITVIGAGSNLLVSSKGIKGGAVFTKNFSAIEFLGETMVQVGAGAKSVALAKALLEKELTGLEFLIGIPGTVGGAVTMNSSAHGQEINQTIISCNVFDIETKQIKTYNKSDLELEYRSSFVQNNKHVILSAVFELKKGNRKEISDLMNFHIEYRKEKHPPLTEPNAGSTFRNPKRGVYIGQMLEEIGAKNWIEGGIKISPKHANFLCNTGNATSLDVSRLMSKVYNTIKEKYGYDLIAEIRFVGEKSEEEEKIWKQFQVH